MPVPVFPDWRVVLARPEVRKSVLSGRGFDRLRNQDRPVAERIHIYISKDDRGRPLPRKERLQRMEVLSRRQVWAAPAILASHLRQVASDFSFVSMIGQRIQVVPFFTAYALNLAGRDLPYTLAGEPYGILLRRDRPDLVLRKMEHDLREIDEVVSNPRTFPHARETFAKSGAEFRRHIAELRTRRPYVGRGRRAIVEEDVVVGLTDAVTRWLDGHGELLRIKHERARGRACSEVQAAVVSLAKSQDVRLGRVSLDEVRKVLFGRPRQKNRTRAIILVAQGLGFSSRTVRKLAETHPPNGPSL